MTKKKEEVNITTPQLLLIMSSVIIGVVVFPVVYSTVVTIIDIAWKCAVLGIIFWVAKKI